MGATVRSGKNRTSALVNNAMLDGSHALLIILGNHNIQSTRIIPLFAFLDRWGEKRLNVVDASTRQSYPQLPLV